jgi:hypothetical protein
MKAWENCRGREIGTCPFFRSATYQAGFTGKSGEETWNKCLYKKSYLRLIKSCCYAGSKKGIDAAIEKHREQGAKG